jgi:hypothetical protein
VLGGAALGLVALTGCDVDDLRPPEDRTTPSPGSSPSAGETAATDPDTLLVDRVATAIIGAAVAVEWARRLPRLRRALAPLQKAHLAHLAALEKELEAPPPQTPASYAVALREVRSTEQALQGTLVSAAVEARSGALARLLASMSASVSQHLETLP